MGLFYAHLNNNQGYEYLLTFISCEVADEWWRMLSTSPSPYAGKIIRNSSQLYIHTNANKISLDSFYYDARLPDANRFYRKMHIQSLSNAVTIPQTTITDHISGRWYFIRSKADPWSHWYVRIKGACLVCGDINCDSVHVSSEYRTRFCIQALNAIQGDVEEPEDFIMIGKDEISITAPKGNILHVNDEDDLKAINGYDGGADLLFGNLKNRFITQAVKQVNGEVWEYVVAVERGAGEPWELVD